MVIELSQSIIPISWRGACKLGQVCPRYLPHIRGGPPCLYSGEDNMDFMENSKFSIQRTLLGLHSRLLPSLLQSVEVKPKAVNLICNVYHIHFLMHTNYFEGKQNRDVALHQCSTSFPRSWSPHQASLHRWALAFLSLAAVHWNPWA